MTVVFATPLAALVALVGLVPIAAAVIRGSHAGRLRRELGLAEPGTAGRMARPLALACAFGLLGLAAAQPSLARQRERLVRTDVQMLVVLDNSRSMLASLRPRTPPRYRRAAAFAAKLHAALPELAAGVASLNNRLLPYLFPTIDDQAYAAVIAHAYGIEHPPPAVDSDPVATDFGELSEIASQRFFATGARKRLLVVLSDAETRSFDVAGTLASLRRVRTTPVVVRFWYPEERIFRPGQPPEPYRATQPGELRLLRDAGWPAYEEGHLGAVVRRIRAVIGSGPMARVGYRHRETSIAPEVALAALAPLLLILVPAVVLPRRRYA